MEIPVEGRTRETKIRRDARGRWFDGDVPIAHEALCRAFDGWVARAPDGRYCLENAINWAYVTIEGAPVFARRLTIVAGAEGQLPVVTLGLSGDREEALDLATLREGLGGVLYCDVRGGSLACELGAGAMMSLAAHLDEEPPPGSDARTLGTVLRLGAFVVRIPRVADPLVPFRGAVVEPASA